VTVPDAGYNAALASGASTDVGFISSWNNTTNSPPTGFTLNGATCSTG
jgi:hypothetical protein